MAEIKTKTVKLSSIKLNPNNPRLISNKKMESLIKSLYEFPEMLNVREVVVDENMICLGGNMRALALRKAGAKTCIVKIVSGWTEDQKRRFVISDNGQWGEWDMEILANFWSDLPLAEFGIDLPTDWLNPGSGEGGNGAEEGSQKEKEKATIVICPNCSHEFSVLKEKKS